MNTGSETFRQRRHDATAEVLIRAAETVMAGHGYERVTMRDIAAAAGCVPGTLYLYFKNKQDVVDAIAKRHSQAVLTLLTEAMATVAEPLDNLETLTRVLVGYVHQNQASYRIVRSVMRARSASFPSGLPEAIRDQWEAFFAQELELIGQAQKRKRIRRDVPPAVVLQFLQVTTVGLLDEWNVGGEVPDPATQMSRIWSFLTHGIGGPS